MNKAAPLYIFANSGPHPNSPSHFFISIRLSFPNRKSISTYALVDSGATASCISERFAERHSLPRRLKDNPIPILAVDDRPIASGLITQDVIACLSVDSHTETRPLAVVAVGYPVILGLDWLRQHNPSIDWAEMNLSLDCCGLSRTHPVTVSAKGSGLKPTLSKPALNSTSMLGLGFGLSGPTIFASSHISGSSAPMSADTSQTSDPSPPIPPMKTSFLSSLVRWTGYGHSTPTLDPSPSPPDIKFIGPSRFKKYAKSNPDSICILRFSPSTTPISVNSISTPSFDDIDDIDPLEAPPTDSSDYLNYVPDKYRAWADSVFCPSEFDKLPPHRPYDVGIELEEGKTPPFGPLYRLTAAEREALAEHIATNLKRGHIRRSTSSAAAPVLFIRKKTGELRLCVDFRGLNSITKKNRYPLPLINDLLDRVQGCKVFSVIDLKSAYSHIRIKEGDEWKTAFRTPYGLFEHLVTPYGLTNAPAAFQAFIQDTLRDFLDIFCVVYLDDILIFSRSQEEHNIHVGKVLDRLRDTQLCANPAKCEFDKSEVEYLGYIISADGVKMNPKKLDTITNWPAPTNVKELQSFLGFTNFYRRFIDSYSGITLPLTALTHKGTNFDFSVEARQAFESLKQHFLTAPILRHFDSTLPCTLCTDASDFALSAVLQQPDDEGTLHPVAFYSRKLTPSEINYEVHDKELLAIVAAFREMRAWLLGSPHPISVITDHNNLKYFMSSQILNRRQARWAMFLSDFDFQLAWGPGHTNVADAPSRRPDFVPQKGDDTLECQRKMILTPEHTKSIFPPTDITLISSLSAPVSALTTLAVDNSALLDRFKTAFRTDTEWREALTRGNSDFTAEGGLVFHKGRLFVPQPLRADILHSRHDQFTAGHPGRNRTLGLVSRDYSWPGINTYVRRYVEACDTCARIKIPRHKPFGLLKPLEIPERPWRAITMDFIVKLPLSHGYDSIWVVCDRLTRAAHFLPCREAMNAPELAWLFLDRIFRLHGLPDSIVSDRGSLFVSKFWKELTSRLSISVDTSTAYHPQTDGLTERTNQTLETYLRAYCSYQQDDWVDYLPLAEFAFNNLENSSLKQTPFFANYGFHPTFEPQVTERSTVPAAADLASRLEQIHTELRAELEHAQALQSQYYDEKRLPAPELQQGQLVWLLRRNIKTTRPSDKLDHRRLGPYRIIRKIGTSSYHLQLPSYLSRLHPVFHVSLLEPYKDPSEFHPHADPTPFELVVDNDPSLSIHSILDCRKVGHRYEYLVHFKNSSDSEDAWIPLSDIPTTYNELLERYHRRHPRAPRPHAILLNKSFSLSDTGPIENSLPGDDHRDPPSNEMFDHSDPSRVASEVTPPSVDTCVASEVSPPSIDTRGGRILVNARFAPAPVPSAVPAAVSRPASPPPAHQNLRSEYVPPPRTTTRSGRVSRPAARLDL